MQAGGLVGGRRALAQELDEGDLLPQERLCSPVLEERDRLTAERVERVELGLGEVAPGAVHDAKGSDRVALGGDERLACVEADRGLVGDERARGEALVPTGVGHDENPVLEDGVAAERASARRLVELEADAGLEPQPVGVDEADHGDRGAADARRERGEVVEGLFGLRVEDVEAAKRVEARACSAGEDIGRILSVHRPRPLVD